MLNKESLRLHNGESNTIWFDKFPARFVYFVMDWRSGIYGLNSHAGSSKIF